MGRPGHGDKAGVGLDLLLCLNGGNFGSNGSVGGGHVAKSFDSSVIVALGLIALGHEKKAVIRKINGARFAQERKSAVIIALEHIHLGGLNIAVVRLIFLNGANHEGQGRHQQCRRGHQGKKDDSAPSHLLR